MAVDVPESFVAQTKTPPKYPPPSSTTSSNRNSLINGNHYHGSPPPPMLRDGQCDLPDLTPALMNWMNQLYSLHFIFTFKACSHQTTS